MRLVLAAIIDRQLEGPSTAIRNDQHGNHQVQGCRVEDEGTDEHEVNISRSLVKKYCGNKL